MSTLRGEGAKVRTQPKRRALHVDPGMKVWFRQPTPTERVELRIDEGVGLVVVEKEGEGTRLLPADEVVIAAVSEHRPRS